MFIEFVQVSWRELLSTGNFVMYGICRFHSSPDVTADGEFRPAIDMTDGGDSNYNVKDTMGLADWTPLTPTIAFTYAQE
jgi:hypothetical protein